MNANTTHLEIPKIVSTDHAVQKLTERCLGNAKLLQCALNLYSEFLHKKDIYGDTAIAMPSIRMDRMWHGLYPRAMDVMASSDLIKMVRDYHVDHEMKARGMKGTCRAFRVNETGTRKLLQTPKKLLNKIKRDQIRSDAIYGEVMKSLDIDKAALLTNLQFLGIKNSRQIKRMKDIISATDISKKDKAKLLHEVTHFTHAVKHPGHISFDLNGRAYTTLSKSPSGLRSVLFKEDICISDIKTSQVRNLLNLILKTAKGQGVIETIKRDGNSEVLQSLRNTIFKETEVSLLSRNYKKLLPHTREYKDSLPYVRQNGILTIDRQKLIGELESMGHILDQDWYQWLVDNDKTPKKSTRDRMKKSNMVFLFNDMRDNQRVCRVVKEHFPELYKLIDVMKLRFHKSIFHSFLTIMEATYTFTAWKRLNDMGIKTGTIHDCIVGKAIHKDIIQQVMDEVAREMYELPPTIVTKVIVQEKNFKKAMEKRFGKI